MENINIQSFVGICTELKDIIDSEISWEAKHHQIFYTNMTIKALHIADEFLMDSYVPAITSNRGECVHLWNHVENKYKYLLELV